MVKTDCRFPLASHQRAHILNFSTRLIFPGITSGVNVIMHLRSVYGGGMNGSEHNYVTRLLFAQKTTQNDSQTKDVKAT